jgi:hypothetical protein
MPKVGQTLKALKSMSPQVEGAKQVNFLTSKKSSASPKIKLSQEKGKRAATTPSDGKPVNKQPSDLAVSVEGGDSALAMLDSFRHSFLTQVPRAKYLSIALLEELSGLNMVVVGGQETPLHATIIDPVTGESGTSSSALSNSTGPAAPQKDRQQLFLRAETHTCRYSRALVYHPEKGFVTDNKRGRDLNHYNFTVTYASPDRSKPLRTVIGVGKTSSFITAEVKEIYEKWGFQTI